MSAGTLNYIENILFFLILLVGFLNIYKFKINYFIKFSKIKIYFILLISYFLICRLPTIFGYDFLIGNPDETHYIANSLNLRNFDYNFDTLEHGTSGILNSVLLGWPELIGLNSTLFLTRLTNTICILLTILLTFKSIKILTNTKISLCALTVLVLFFTDGGKVGYHYHQGYVSEIFPILFISYIILVINIFLIEKKCSTFNIVFTSLIFGMLPFTKLQSVVIGIFLWLVFIYQLYKIKNFKFAIVSTFVSLMPPFLILIPLIIKNNFNDFFVPYILNNIARADKMPVPKLNQLIDFIFIPHINKFFLYLILFSFLVIFLSKSIKKLINSKIIFHFFTLLVSCYSVWQARYFSDHYSHFIIFQIAIFSSLVFSTSYNVLSFSYNFIKVNEEQSNSNFIYNKISNVLLIFLILFIFLIPRESFLKKFRKMDFYNFDKYDKIHNGNLFNFVSINSQLNYIYVWGWNSKYYLYSGMLPATKRPWFEHEILDQFFKYSETPEGKKNPEKNSKYTNYFINDTLEDLEKNKPAIIMDTVIKGSIGFELPLNFKKISIPDKINNFIKNNYIQINKNNLCPKIYVREKIYNLFKEKIVLPYKVMLNENESYENLENLSNFDVSLECKSDLIFSGSDSEITFKFDNKKISNIWILSTLKDKTKKNKNINLNIKTVEGEIIKKKITLNNYPRWTEINLNKDLHEVDTVYMDNLSDISGLKEVVFYN